MPKTRDAFALKDFDSYNFVKVAIFGDIALEHLPPPLDDPPRIFYRSLDIGEGYDPIEGVREDIIFWVANGSYHMAQQKLERVISLRGEVWRYQWRVSRHKKRLMMLCRNGFNFGEWCATAKKLERLSLLILCYETAEKKISRLLASIDKCISDVQDRSPRITFSVRLKKARLAANLTQTQLAAQLNLSQSGYNLYETMNSEPSLATLINISKKLNCSVDWLLGLK